MSCKNSQNVKNVEFVGKVENYFLNNNNLKYEILAICNPTTTTIRTKANIVIYKNVAATRNTLKKCAKRISCKLAT